MEIPTMQKAIVYNDPGHISTEMVQLPIPEPGPGDVLINLTHSGVCHSDIGIMTCSWTNLPYPTPKGQIGGHEGVGVVVKLGPGAETAGVKIGDRVGVKWVASACGRCEPCHAAADGVCFNQKISGYFTPGTFQQYVVSPANYVTPIPHGLDSAEAAPLLCAGMTVNAALKRSNAKPGQWVVIVGAGGGLGHLAVQLGSRGMGLRVIGVDHGSKMDAVISYGAEKFVDITQFSKDDNGDAIAAHVKELSGGLGAHAAVVCTAINAAYSQALRFLRFNGTLVCVGIPEHTPVAISSAFPGNIVVNQWTITGSTVGSRYDAIETLDYAARGVLKANIRVEKMERLNDVFKEMVAGTIQGRVVLDLS